jgi:hypothetical protein
MRGGDHVAHMENMRILYKISIGKSEENRTLE